jgi:expansin (peptidoglycan-binding protein)
MQSIARLAGPVVHGFKRGSKLLGWWVATRVRDHCNNATNVPALL